MDYYERKKRTIDTIEKLVERNRYSKEEIAFMILREFAISEKFSLEFIERNIETGLFEEEIVSDGVKTTKVVFKKKK